jgi:PAS domain S-box-containing protein
MAGKDRPIWLRYGAAVASVALATCVRWLLNAPLEDRVPYATFFFAVAFSAWYGGRGPGLVAVVLGALSAAHFFVAPQNSLLITDPAELLGLGMFIVLGLLITLLCDSLRTARDRAEENARAGLVERQRLRVTLASIGDAVIVTDNHGQVEFLNAEAERLTGWTTTQVQGQPLEVVFPIFNERTGRKAENPVRRVLQEGQVVGLANHTVLRAKNGKEYAIDDSAAPIRDADGNAFGVILVFRDITEKRRLEVEQNRLAAITASSEDAVFGLTLDGRVTDWNAGSERLYG